MAYGHFGVFLVDFGVSLEVKCTSGTASASVHLMEIDEGPISDTQTCAAFGRIDEGAELRRAEVGSKVKNGTMDR